MKKPLFQLSVALSGVILVFLFFLTARPASAAWNFLKDSGVDQSASQGGYVIGSEATDINAVIGQVIAVVLGLVGVIFMAFLIYGGYVWMTAAGNEDKVKKATKTITNSLVGLIVVLASYAISYFIISQFTF